MDFNSKKDGIVLSNANAFLTGYITLLRKNRIPEETITLYVHWVKEFVRHLNNIPLNKCTVTDVKDFLVHLSKNNKIDPAQIEQARQALRVLYRDFFKFGWAMQKISKPTIVIPACGKSLLNSRKDSGQANSRSDGAAGMTEKATSKNHTYEFLINKLKTEIRFRHYSIRTEQTYVQWTQRFLYFHRTKQVDTISAEDIKAYLEYLAVQRSVAASTQNQALNALVFLYEQVLKKEIGEIGEFTRAKRPVRLPVVLAKGEVDKLLNALSDIYALMAGLLYGSGLRLMECVRLRVKDIDFAQNQIIVRDGKGRKTG